MRPGVDVAERDALADGPPIEDGEQAVEHACRRPAPVVGSPELHGTPGRSANDRVV